MLRSDTPSEIELFSRHRSFEQEALNEQATVFVYSVHGQRTAGHP